MIRAASAAASLPSGRSSITRIAKVRNDASYDGILRNHPRRYPLRIVVHPAGPRVRVGAGQRDNAAPLRERVPSRQRRVRAIEQRRERFGRPERIPHERARKVSAAARRAIRCRR